MTQPKGRKKQEQASVGLRTTRGKGEDVTDLSKCSRDDSLDDSSSLFVQQMNLVDDQQLDLLLRPNTAKHDGSALLAHSSDENKQDTSTHTRELPFPRWLPRHHVPLLRSRHDDLGVRDLFPRQLHVTCANPTQKRSALPSPPFLPLTRSLSTS